MSVLGAGSWGTALAIAVSHNVKKVKLWGRNTASMNEMQSTRENKRYLPGVTLPQNLEIEPSLSNLIDSALCFLIVVPSHAFSHTLESLHNEIIRRDYNPDDATIVWGTKGFEPRSGELLGDVARKIFGSHAKRAIVSGPSFAKETAISLPTALTTASANMDQAKSLAHWFRTPSTRVYHSDDIIGVQIGGAVKNIMAIAAGISDGLGYGANARAALITRGLSELTRLGLALGGRSETFMGLTGVGDLILTCTDNQSRNRRFGLGVGQGKSQAEITKEIGQEIEGIQTVKELYMISEKLNVDMPITEQVYRVLHLGDDPKIAVQRLLQRNPKAETT
ncbi:MAG: NAD(P)H-dependent glycerol-3-phosphate dehydrogenase [Gammaproteobacteria bacterium]|nr:NAD(P)H-dependent glycerol-3-phosphate dehydrogenase [Gammaproteobacteria bacterium]